MLTKVEVLNIRDEGNFKSALTQLLNKGYELKSSSVGFVNSERYKFCPCYQALLIKIKDNVTKSPKHKIGTKVKLTGKDLLCRGQVGEIIGYQGPMFEHKTSDSTTECLYVIEFFDQECDINLTYAFEFGDFVETE